MRRQLLGQSRERGQASLFVIALLGLFALFATLLVLTGEIVVDRAKAQAAADAAALAGVVEGEGDARTFAQLNGAALESFSVAGSQATVRVRVGRVVATATAERRERVVFGP